MSKSDAAALADHLCAIIAGLTAHRQGSGPHWIMVETIGRELRRHGFKFSGDDLQSAIAIAVERCVLKTEGDPVHSVSVWQKDWKIARP